VAPFAGALSHRSLMRPASAAWIALSLALAVAGSDSFAQAPGRTPHPDPQGASVPDIPSGPGVLSGTIVHRDPGHSTGGISVGLYSLSADGQPSLRQGTTDAEGRFRFEDLSNAPSRVYLVGVRIDDVPFGTRVAFAPGTTEATTEIEIHEPVADREALALEESRVEFEWRGAALNVRENHRIENRGERVVRWPLARAPEVRAPLEIDLPEGASPITPAFGQVAEHFERRGQRLLYWGPLHPGSNDIGFSYDVTPLATDAGDPQVRYQPRIAPTPGSFVALVPEGLSVLSADGLEAGAASDAEGRTVYQRFDPAAGIAMTLLAPAYQSDPAAVEIASANLWLELDDTALDTRIDYALRVDGEAPLAASDGQPLFTLSLPPGAELLGIAPAAASIGAVPGADSGTLEIHGPLPAGESVLRLHYRVPAETSGIDLAFSFPRDLRVLNLLVADTGIEIESDRLHRRRPARVGTRLYLQREAFDVGTDEVVELRLRPATTPKLPRDASRAALFVLAALAMAFTVAPLRRGRESESESAVAESGERIEREAVYAALRDLEHDFETGKLDAPDHQRLKHELEVRAAHLLSAEDAHVAARTCSGCGAAILGEWRFCAGCGATL